PPPSPPPSPPPRSSDLFSSFLRGLAPRQGQGNPNDGEHRRHPAEPHGRRPRRVPPRPFVALLQHTRGAHAHRLAADEALQVMSQDRKSTRLNSSHEWTS